ncbi:MAG TPA: hypothetical protein PLU41_06970 [Acidobacteriota bacterium]|nr:hypothetical protein [Acidobacteriota bacterium]
MSNSFKIALIVAFAALVPFIGGACSCFNKMNLSPMRGGMSPDGTGTMTIWMGGVRPTVEDESGNVVTGSYSFLDYHQEGASYDMRVQIIHSNKISVDDVGGVGILQFPDDITGFAAVYDDYMGHSGPLEIQAGLSTVPITSNHALNAEPGHQLVIVRVPPALVPAEGAPELWYENTMTFQINPVRPIQVKAIMAATVPTGGGGYYYLPVCPAVRSFADVPPVEIPETPPTESIPFPRLADLPHPGGPLVYNLDEGSIYALRYFPRLDFNSAAHTEGFGFVNTGTKASTVTFHAYDVNGQSIADSPNWNWPAGGQGAYQAEGLLQLSQPAQGWVEARTSEYDLLGFFLTQWFPWGFLEGMDGAAVFTETMNIGVIPRIQMQSPYTTEVQIVNPGYEGMSVALQKSYATGGNFLGSFPVPARGALVTDLTAYGSFDGALYLESGHPFIATATIRHGNDCVATANAVAFGDRAETLFASHIVLWPGIYSTSINLHNGGNGSDATAEIRPYYANGTPMAAPFNVTVPRSATVTLTDTQLGLPDGASSEGWLEIRSPGKPLAGCITFGDPVRHLYESTLPLQAAGSKNFYYAQVANGDVGGVVYSTGISVVNPSTTTPVNISISVHKSDGTLNGNVVNRTLAPGEKYVRQLSTMEGVGTLENQASGYIHVTAEAPVLSFVLFFDQQFNFMSAVQAQSK